MSAESDLLRVVLALQMGFVTKEQVVECGAIWAEDQKTPLTVTLAEKGYLKSGAKAALEGMVKAKIDEYGGNAVQSLQSLTVDREIIKSLADLPLEDDAKKSLLELYPTPKILSLEDSRVQTVVVTQSERERYEPGPEIGRGGLGRVVTAKDKVLGREVAIKEMLREADQPDVLKRFLREGEIAGRLSHPNIIPVLDIGTRETESSQSPRPYIVMTRIQGQDLHQILGQIRDGDESITREFSRPRLLRVFQDACLAMAYAHDHGVIHRDLKPANVMVGNYGEVYIVDWGLAKVKGQMDDPGATLIVPSKSEDEGRNDCQGLTVEGQVLGTPAYMPPEQADGRISEIDESSDIYSLGAILYEVLTFHPPFEGSSGYNVIAKVITSEPVAPSKRISDLSEEVNSGQVGSEKVIPESVPRELEDICLKALSKEKSHRYSTCMDFANDIQSFLDGEKTKEKLLDLSKSHLTSGLRIISETKEKIAKLANQEAMAKQVLEKEMSRGRGKDYRSGWELEDSVRAARADIAEQQGLAESLFRSSLNLDKNNSAASEALAAFYWEKFREEEKAGNTAQMVYFETLVREFNNGQMMGHGSLSVLTTHYSCPCLLEGREIESGELNIHGYHPFSGRALDGSIDGEGLPHLENDGVVRIKAHGSRCDATPLSGAQAWLFVFNEIGRLMTPVFPENIPNQEFSAREIPEAILDKCYQDDSPFKPKTEGLYLGQTPINEISVPEGSYLLILSKPGYYPMRVAIRIERDTAEESETTLFKESEIPSGYLPVPKGTFIYQGVPEKRDSTQNWEITLKNEGGTETPGPMEILATEDILVSKYPIRCREYLEFLEHIDKESKEDAESHIPRYSIQADMFWPRDKEQGISIPTSTFLEAHGEECGENIKVMHIGTWGKIAEWEEEWPILSISWRDAMSFAAWKREKSNYVITLPHEIEWEKAARGVDGRSYPWGNYMNPTFCQMSESKDPKPVVVGHFPADESPYGVRGMGGNSSDHCLNESRDLLGGYRICRGGAWLRGSTRLETKDNMYVTDRIHQSISGVREDVGFRLCIYLRLTPELSNIPT
jgi:serine/threonine protein kinase/formylglycine-generating enzyme required for sulfatase activity